MTDLLLGVLIALIFAAGVAGPVVVVRARAALDRRFSGVGRRLDDLAAHVAANLTSQEQAMREALTTTSERTSDELAAATAKVMHRINERTASIRPGKQSVEQRTRRAVAQDLHALLSLHAGLPLSRESLVISSYAAAPDAILHLTSLVAALPNNALVVELGSGLSTVWMAAAARREDRGIRIVSIDHDDRWAVETRAALARLGLDAVAEVRLAPLERLPGTDEGATGWYALGAFDDLDDICLLVVDGPPAATGVGARYPAVPQLVSRIAAEARIVLDDTDRAEEQMILERWCAELTATRPTRIERVLDRTTVIHIGPLEGE